MRLQQPSIATSIIVPTFRRPESLARAVRSCFAQSGVADGDYEIVVVDNSPEASARGIVATLADKAGPRIVYVHEPRPGVSYARNTGIRTAAGERLAFLDDDEAAPAHWLGSLIRAQAELAADVVFGPVLPRFEGEPKLDRAFVATYFSRLDPEPTRLIDHYHGTGNSLMLRSRCILDDEPFDPVMARCGGEDTIFFEGLHRAGRQFGWCAEAEVYEYVPEDRTTLGYLCRRSFRRGQGPSYACGLVDPPDWLGAARWMVIGVGQTLVYGAAALALGALRSPSALDFARRAVEGTGKVLWMRPFRPAEYGGSGGQLPP